MSDQEKQKNYRTEWSFSFEDLGKRVDEFVRSLGAGNEDAFKTERFTEPVGGATRASIRLDAPVGTTLIRPASGDALIDAEVTHVGQVTFAVAGDDEKKVTLSQHTNPGEWMRGIFGWIGKTENLRWDIALTRSIPLDIDIHSGVGKAEYDLRELTVTELDIHGGTGETDIVLPASSELLRATVNGGVGEIEVEVPAGANVNLQVRAGTGRIELEVGDDAAVTAVIRGGIGECEISLPRGAEARLEARMGMGSVDVPPTFARVKGDDNPVGKNGVWQTAGYETAERKISLSYDGGLGGLRLRQRR